MELKSIKTKYRKRVGRGISAGGGKTAGRGTKGQKSRSGHNIPRKWEGGQTALSMRLPILPGFKSGKTKAIVISLDEISKNFKDGATISLSTLIDKCLIKAGDRVKILANGKLTIKVKLDSTVQASAKVKELFQKPEEKKIETKVKPEKKKSTSK